MGVYEERALQTHGMHWQQHQHERYLGPAYDPSRDLSPNLPACDGASSMGDVDPGSLCSSSSSEGSTCSTPSNNNNNSNLNNNNHNHQACSNPQQCGINHTTTSSSTSTTSCHNTNSLSSCTNIPQQCHNTACAQSCISHHNAAANRCQSSACITTLNDDLCRLQEHQVPKLEPPSTPPALEHQEVVVCAGCGQRISDRFYLQAVDRRWHAACLQCCQCRHTLDGEITCFSRDGNIYCKKDYYRLFGMKRCARCQAAILSSELVMRARDLVFHVHCFTCAVCNSPLTKGDHFGMRDATVLCRLHYEMSHSEPTTGVGPYSSGPHYPPPFPSPDFHPHHQVSPSPMSVVAPPSGIDCSTNKVPYYNGAPTGTPRQKGRPRKRKPKDLESMTANLDLNSDYLDMPFGRSPGTPGMHGSNQRTKRMRTSFKHHQLRTMKSYFAINHNPDAKDLKQLSQKTGLPKRVLQVWFQNARAKWRRVMLKQEGKSGDKCSGSESGMGDLDIYPQGPGSLTGSIQSLPPHSPQFMLGPGPGSPSSLDCA